VKCAIVYTDSVFEGESPDAPSLDVQIILYADTSNGGGNVGTLQMYGWDYYLLEQGKWIGVNGDTDLIDHVLHRNPEKVLKGRMITRNEWADCLGVAKGLLKKFPNKSAWTGAFEHPDKNRDGQTV